MSDRTIVNIEVLNNLSHSFTMSDMFENNRDALSRIDGLRISRPCFFVAKNGLSIVILIAILLLERRLYICLFRNKLLSFKKFGSFFNRSCYTNLFNFFHIKFLTSNLILQKIRTISYSSTAAALNYTKTFGVIG